jgi:hypothetical protein
MPDTQGPDLRNYQPQDHETLSVGAAAVGLTAAKAGAAALAELVCETDGIRYWKDSGISGNNPTAAQGILVGAGEKFYLFVPELGGFRAIRVTGDATLQVTYYAPRALNRNWQAA